MLGPWDSTNQGNVTQYSTIQYTDEHIKYVTNDHPTNEHIKYVTNDGPTKIDLLPTVMVS